MLLLKNVKFPDSNFVNSPKVGAYGDKPPACNILCCITAVFCFPFLSVFPQCVFRNIHQKSFNLIFFCLGVTSAHGLCPPVNRPRQSRRGQRGLPALWLPGGVLGTSQRQIHSSCQSRKGICILGAW